MYKKVLIGALAAAALGAGAYLLPGSGLGGSGKPEDIAADYRDLLAEAESLRSAAGVACADRKSLNQQIEDLENELSRLESRKKKWLDSAPELPEAEPEKINQENPLGRPGSEVPELSSDAPPLPDMEPETIGSQVPELSSDVPPLPDISLESIDSEFTPELPEINTGRPGSEIPELSSDAPPLPDIGSESIDVQGRPGSQVPELGSDAPPLPEIDELDIFDPDDPFSQMQDFGQRIGQILEELRALCQEDEATPARKKPVSDKCSDACKQYKDCAAYTEDITPADLEDVYATCIEECAGWPTEMVKCINAIEIKIPNDCVGFLSCRLPQYYEEKYLE